MNDKPLNEIYGISDERQKELDILIKEAVYTGETINNTIDFIIDHPDLSEEERRLVLFLAGRAIGLIDL